MANLFKYRLKSLMNGWITPYSCFSYLSLYHLNSNPNHVNNQLSEQALCSQSSVLALESAPKDELESLRNWVDGNNRIIKKESYLLSDSEDLCSLSSSHREKDALQRFIERKFAKYFITNVCSYNAGHTPLLCIETKLKRNTAGKPKPGRTLMCSSIHQLPSNGWYV
jgi:hypothetical protein